MSSRLVVAVTAIVALAACSEATKVPVRPVYSALMSGANEVPAVATTAAGKASFTLVGRTLQFAIYDSAMSGVATGAHIHTGAAGAPGAVVVPFTHTATANGTVAAGTINLDGALVTVTQGAFSTTGTITGDALLALLASGNAYVNIHTAANPGGEVRGQLSLRPF